MSKQQCVEGAVDNSKHGRVIDCEEQTKLISWSRVTLDCDVIG